MTFFALRHSRVRRKWRFHHIQRLCIENHCPGPVENDCPGLVENHFPRQGENHCLRPVENHCLRPVENHCPRPHLLHMFLAAHNYYVIR
ncbi:hypothetical protein EYF80_032482 [Liparis tanakae]|uniref:Uncharacterized protein n=1 Tax=Liparis tanakae TaxID=230148 RepID=A0A4Z2GX00_9TELE|nr:hypothetical protein EYF80_032482 [Liparis tanakae]